MNWSSLAEFLAMGGYGQYVWGSVGVVALLLCAEVAQLALSAAGQSVINTDQGRPEAGDET